MCDVCNLDSEDWKKKNGKNPLEGAFLHCVYIGAVAKLNLCKLHSIELFRIGESRFLRNHINLAIDLNENKQRYSVKTWT